MWCAKEYNRESVKQGFGNYLRDKKVGKECCIDRSYLAFHNLNCLFHGDRDHRFSDRVTIGSDYR
jgi:hypothetical protein